MFREGRVRPNTMKDIGWIALAGATGTVCRFLASGWAQRAAGDHFPWGTLAVNVVGCFLFGLVVSLAEGRELLSVRVKVILLAGFLGAFTTFSTFGFEAVNYLRDGQLGAGLLHVVAHNLLGLSGVLLGVWLGRLF